jgi:hypothetical protein
MLLKAAKQFFLSEDVTIAEDTSDLGHAQPDLPVNNVNNSISTGDAYVDDSSLALEGPDLKINCPVDE